MSEIVLLGGGGHARVVLNLLHRTGFEVIGYTAPEPSKDPTSVPYLGTDSDFANSNFRGVAQAAMGIGKMDSSDLRIELFHRLTAHAVGFPVIQSPGSIIHDDVGLAAGTVIMDGVTVVTGTVIGAACIVNTNATIDHDCKLGDDVHIAPGAVLCGNVRIGSSTLIGAGAVVAPSVSISERCIIGAASTVIADITSPGTYVGSPVRRVG